MIGVHKLKRDREIQVLYLRRSGMTFTQIAREMEISRQRVHQIYKDAIAAEKTINSL